MKVLVTGASGFVGNHTIDALLAAGHSVVGLSRTLPKPGRRKAGATYFDGVDIGDKATLKAEFFDGVESVVHLVGIIQERGKAQTFKRIHVEGTVNVVQAACKAGSVKKIVYMSAIGSEPDAAAEYSRTKAAAEDIVRRSGIEFTILRPSIILGKDGEFVASMKDLVLHGGMPVNVPFPFIPVPGAGNNKFQPIYVDDLMTCTVKSVAPGFAAGQTIEIGGETQVTFNALLTSFAKRLGTRKPLFHAPLSVLSLIAPLVALLPNPPFTGDQLLNLQTDNICDNTPMKKLFEITPLSFEQAMDLTLPLRGSLPLRSGEGEE